MTDQTLRELIDSRKRGRSWESLGRHVGVSANTVRGWAAGRHPMPEFRAAAIAEWLNVTESDVVAAATASLVGAEQHTSPVATDANGGRMSDMQVQAVGDFIATMREALDALERAMVEED